MKKLEKLTVGLIPLARPTFDVHFAKQVCSEAWELINNLSVNCVGSSELLFDAEAVEKQLLSLKDKHIDLLLIMQLTFTDATMTVKLAQSFNVPILFWSFPEARTGGRLRLNSLCGVNLAAHALGKTGIQCDYINLSPSDPETNEKLTSWMRAFQAYKNLSNTKIAVIGDHPDGFDTCSYDSKKLREISGATVERIELSDLFDEAKKIDTKQINSIRRELESKIEGLDLVEQEPLEKSFRILATLRNKAKSKGFDGFSVRCWPEFFTEYGCAACGAMGVLNSQGIASGCEADVYGTLSTLILNWLGEEPSFIADLVDINSKHDTGVFWHCGLAPMNMADPETSIEAGIHSNRKKPLVNEFALKPGEVTLFRLSQSKNMTRMVIGKGNMLKAPKSFSGTSGVIRFERPASEVLDTVIKEGLEHHYAITYGNVSKTLSVLARQLNIPVLELN